MTFKSSRLETIVTTLLVMLGVSLALVACSELSHLAHADAGSGSAIATDAGPAAAPATAAATTIDPVGDPLGAGSTILKLWKSGAILPALIVGAFGILALLRKYVGWFSTGKQAAYVAAGVVFLTTLLPAALGGSTPTLEMLVAAIGGAVLLVIHPASPTPAKDAA